MHTCKHARPTQTCHHSYQHTCSLHLLVQCFDAFTRATLTMHTLRACTRTPTSAPLLLCRVGSIYCEAAFMHDADDASPVCVGMVYHAYLLGAPCFLRHGGHLVGKHAASDYLGQQQMPPFNMWAPS
jgi:hypothetical protein